MTRINLVPPSELTDQHLFAEYREIRMVPASLARSLRARRADAVLAAIPPRFTLNAGHVTFFYDKGRYLERRYRELMDELDRRGINFTRGIPFDRFAVFADPHFAGDYEPTNDDLRLVRERIALRISERPGFYRYMGQPIDRQIDVRGTARGNRSTPDRYQADGHAAADRHPGRHQADGHEAADRHPGHRQCYRRPGRGRASMRSVPHGRPSQSPVRKSWPVREEPPRR